MQLRPKYQSDILKNQIRYSYILLLNDNDGYKNGSIIYYTGCCRVSNLDVSLLHNQSITEKDRILLKLGSLQVNLYLLFLITTLFIAILHHLQNHLPIGYQFQHQHLPLKLFLYNTFSHNNSHQQHKILRHQQYKILRHLWYKILRYQ